MGKLIAVSLVVAYLSTGSWCGYSLSRTIPAVNLAGATYFALTWPFWLKVSPIQLPIPQWAFTFKVPAGREALKREMS